ncbi:hypothetical protein RQP46_007977 [Phenoliferia psychrophenolica]
MNPYGPYSGFDAGPPPPPPFHQQQQSPPPNPGPGGGQKRPKYRGKNATPGSPAFLYQEQQARNGNGPPPDPQATGQGQSYYQNGQVNWGQGGQVKNKRGSRGQGNQNNNNKAHNGYLYQPPPPLPPPPQTRDPRDQGGATDLIRERKSRERPCRTLFARNIAYDTPTEMVRDKFDRVGEIKAFFDLIATRGMVFVTYWDLRPATTAKDAVHGTEINGRQIDVHYSLPKDLDTSQRCSSDKNQGTLMLTVRGAQSPVQDPEVWERFSTFGELKSVLSGPEMRRDERRIEFWDSRAPERARVAMEGQRISGGTMALELEWDLIDPEPAPEPPLRPAYRDEPPRNGGGYSGPPDLGPPPREYGSGYPTHPDRGPPPREYDYDYGPSSNSRYPPGPPDRGGPPPPPSSSRDFGPPPPSSRDFNGRPPPPPFYNNAPSPHPSLPPPPQSSQYQPPTPTAPNYYAPSPSPYAPGPPPPVAPLVPNVRLSPLS